MLISVNGGWSGDKHVHFLAPKITHLQHTSSGVMICLIP